MNHPRKAAGQPYRKWELRGHLTLAWTEVEEECEWRAASIEPGEVAELGRGQVQASNHRDLRVVNLLGWMWLGSAWHTVGANT